MGLSQSEFRERMSNQSIQVSAIVPVGGRQTALRELYAEYRSGMKALGVPFEFIFVLDGPQPGYEKALAELVTEGEPITVISLSRYFGEATAIMVGFDHAAGAVIMTLPAYLQVEGSEIKRYYDAIDGADVVVGHREPRATRWFDSLRRRAFHGLLAYVTRLHFHDLGCNARAVRRKVLEEVRLYGDQQRFLPVLAERQGFRVAEIAVKQSAGDRHDQPYELRNYTRGFLDIFNVFFLVRFTKKPLRFFGMIGVATFGIGIIELLYLVFDRIFLSTPLADRPALLLASLLIVLGVQIFALGLLGELIIFTHAGGSKDYQVDRVVQYPGADLVASPAKSAAASPVKVVA
jgi:glycosyltransferase involved in cell wall biosynthesis